MKGFFLLNKLKIWKLILKISKEDVEHHTINDIESSITFVDSTHSRFDCTYEYLANSWATLIKEVWLYTYFTDRFLIWECNKSDKNVILLG